MSFPSHHIVREGDKAWSAVVCEVDEDMVFGPAPQHFTTTATCRTLTLQNGEEGGRIDLL